LPPRACTHGRSVVIAPADHPFEWLVVGLLALILLAAFRIWRNTRQGATNKDQIEHIVQVLETIRDATRSVPTMSTDVMQLNTQFRDRLLATLHPELQALYGSLTAAQERAIVTAVGQAQGIDQRQMLIDICELLLSLNLMDGRLKVALSTILDGKGLPEADAPVAHVPSGAFGTPAGDLAIGTGTTTVDDRTGDAAQADADADTDEGGGHRGNGTSGADALTGSLADVETLGANGNGGDGTGLGEDTIRFVTAGADGLPALRETLMRTGGSVSGEQAVVTSATGTGSGTNGGAPADGSAATAELAVTAASRATE
jgi:hypothetical protein